LVAAIIFLSIQTAYTAEGFTVSPQSRPIKSTRRTIIQPLFAKQKKKERARRRAAAAEQRDTSFDPVLQQKAAQQFTPRYLQYEVEKIAGRREVTFNKATPESLPSKEERSRLSEKIARLLNDDLDYDATSATALAASEEIADRAAVFAQLSEEDKNEATFAVSRQLNRAMSSVSDEPLRRGNKARKGKVTASVLETGSDTIKQYVKSMGQHQVLSPEDESVLGKHIQILARWEEQRQVLEETLLR
jgi:hypothetical protein